MSNSEKSHVGLGYHVCLVCGEKNDEVILFDTKLKKSLEFMNNMGINLCKEHSTLHLEGYVACVEISNKEETASTLNSDQANRTGRLLHMKQPAWDQIFNVEFPIKPMVFIDPESFSLLLELFQSDAQQEQLQ